jgi:hypothetical protein
VPPPRRAGTYSGTFTVLEDSSRLQAEEDELLDTVGTRFERTFVFAEDCDLAGSTCSISHDSLAVYAPEPFNREWQWTDRDTRSQTATYTEQVTDDCVGWEGADQVVGEFDTTVTQTITLSRPVTDATGTLRWTTAEVVFVEDAVSDDTDMGCYTSRFRAEGELHRQPGN